MTLVPQKGFRSVYTWSEVMEFFGMKRRQVKWLIESGQLVKRHKGKFPFAQADVNSFLNKLNAGKVAR